MKFFIVALALVAAVSAQQAKIIQITRESPLDISPEGSYSWSYEAENGIAAQEQGSLKQVSRDAAGNSAQGSFQYVSPDGTPIAVTYVADENGFQPQGAHLPVAPAIPEAIARAIEWNLAHPEQDNLRK